MNTDTPKPIVLPCGAMAYWDHSSDMAYRCYDCFTVVGSVGMPRDCYELLKREKSSENSK